MSDSMALPAPRRPHARAGEQVRVLQVRTERAALRHVEDFEMLVRVAARVAGEIADGGEAYPQDVRAIARSMAGEMDARIESLATLALEARS